MKVCIPGVWVGLMLVLDKWEKDVTEYYRLQVADCDMPSLFICLLRLQYPIIVRISVPRLLRDFFNRYLVLLWSGPVLSALLLTVIHILPSCLVFFVNIVPMQILVRSRVFFPLLG